jgi:penicillin amidase
MTAAGIDQTDFFAEKINPDDSLQYLSPDGWREFEIVSETIHVADTSDPLIVRLKYTERGPVVLEDDSLQFAYSLRWSGFDMDLAKAAGAALSMGDAADFDSFRESVTGLAALNSNWLYADTAGNIGYQLGAPIPARAEGAVNLAHNGWETSASWNGYYPLEETPWALNPQQGWLANCNNKQDQGNLNYHLQGSFFADRILRVSERLDEESSFDIAKTQELQLEWIDQYFLRWQEEIAVALESIGESIRAAELRAWDGSTVRDSREAALVAEFIYQLKLQMFEDELGDLTSRMKRLWVDQVYHSEHEFWFDDLNTADVTESRDDITQRALRAAVDAVGDSLWGDIHTLTIAHPFAFVVEGAAALGLRRGPYSRGGSGGSFVIDLADPQTTYMCAPAGNSGNPLSEHFFDFFPLWEQGHYWKVSLNREVTYSSAKSILTLIPES